MKRVVLGLAVLLLALGAAAGWVYAYAEPTREALDKDLAEVRADIKAAEQEATQYQGGAILAQIHLRRSILRNTEAMLDQKRRALLRLIELDFVVGGQRVPAPTDEQMAKVQKDIEKAEGELGRAEAQAVTSGGLIGALAKVTAETSRTSLALLKMKYYTGKYGIPLMMFDFDKATPTKAPPSSPGKAVKDEDALR